MLLIVSLFLFYVEEVRCDIISCSLLEILIAYV